MQLCYIFSYGKRTRNGKTYLTKRTEIFSIEQKEKSIKNILDEDIKNDLLNKLNLSSTEWSNLLKNYVHPKKKTVVKKVLKIETEGIIEKDSNGHERIGEFCDFGTKGTNGQFKKSKGHKGQILYYNERGSIKVMPVYANLKTQDVKDKLLNMGCKLYAGGEMFQSGCLVKIPNDFKAGTNTHPAGIYKLRTIITKGNIKIENNNGIEILSSASNLAQAGFRRYKKKVN